MLTIYKLKRTQTLLTFSEVKELQLTLKTCLQQNIHRGKQRKLDTCKPCSLNITVNHRKIETLLLHAR